MLKAGEILDGKYKILSEIGHGGMSTVYLALNERANKTWAIKEVRKSAGNDSEIVQQNLVAEIEMLKKLSHPKLVSIVDVIDTADSFIIVMDYILGQSMQQRLRDTGAQNLDDVIEWAMQLADVLDYLHRRKPPIIYRDLKPANIMLKPDGSITLIDFGTAREYKDTKQEDTTYLGTRGYAAPEQFGGKGQTDARTDIYTLGATMYHLLTGYSPADTQFVIYPIGQLRPELAGTGIEKIVAKCCQPNPDDRYQSCDLLIDDLKRVGELNDTYINARKKRLRLLATCSVLAVLLIFALTKLLTHVFHSYGKELTYFVANSLNSPFFLLCIIVISIALLVLCAKSIIQRPKDPPRNDDSSDHPTAQVFISYKNEDSSRRKTFDYNLAKNLHTLLKSTGINTFFSDKEMHVGEHYGDFKTAIDKALDDASILIVVADNNESLNSKWIKYEIKQFKSNPNRPRRTIFIYAGQSLNVQLLPDNLKEQQVFRSYEDEKLLQEVIIALKYPTVKSKPKSSFIDQIKNGASFSARYKIGVLLKDRGDNLLYEGTDHNMNSKIIVRIWDNRCEKCTTEYRILSRLSGIPVPGIPHVLDYENHNDYSFYVQSYIKGISLREFQRNANYKLSEDQIIDICRKVFNVLSSIHGLDKPIIHGNLKPANILLAEGNVFLINFYGAMVLDDNMHQLSENVITGKYASRIQKQKLDPTVKIDIHSMGCIMFELINTDPKTVFSLDKIESNFTFSDGLKYVILRCLDISDERQYATCNQVLNDLDYLDTLDHRFKTEVAKIRAAGHTHLFGDDPSVENYDDSSFQTVVLR